MTREQMIEALRGRVGTAAELAQRCDCDPRDSTFRRALRALVDDGGLFKSAGVYHPRVVASGAGAAVELGIQGGPRVRDGDRWVASAAALRRTEAFAVMSVRAAKSEHPIGAGHS